MKVKFHGKAPRGFPPSIDGKVESVLFLVGETKDLKKDWFDALKDHPQVKSLFMKGSYDGLEILGNHEKALAELYPRDLPSKEERFEQAYLAKEAALAFSLARTKSEPSADEKG